MVSTACHKPITWEKNKAQRRCKLHLSATAVLIEEGWEETKEKGALLEGLQVTSSLLLLAIARLRTVELPMVKNTSKVTKTVTLD